MASKARQLQKKMEASSGKKSTTKVPRSQLNSSSDLEEHENQSKHYDSSDEDTEREFSASKNHKRLGESASTGNVKEQKRKKQKKEEQEQNNENNTSEKKSSSGKSKAKPSSKTKKTTSSSHEKIQKDIQQVSKKDDTGKIILKHQDLSEKKIMKQLAEQLQIIQQLQESVSESRKNSEDWKEHAYPAIQRLMKNNKIPDAKDIRKNFESSGSDKSLERAMKIPFQDWWEGEGRSKCKDYVRQTRGEWNRRIKQYYLDHEEVGLPEEQINEVLKKYLDEDTLTEIAAQIYCRTPTESDKAWVYFGFSRVARGLPIKVERPRKIIVKVDPSKPSRKLDPKELMKIATGEESEQESEKEAQSEEEKEMESESD